MNSKCYYFIVCMVRPLEMAVLLLSVPPLLDHSLLHLYPTRMTDLPSSSENLIGKCLHSCPLAPASDYSNLQIRTSPLK